MATRATNADNATLTVAAKPDRRMRPRLPRDVVAQRAYELYLQRGGEHGRDMDDWFNAECELRMLSSEDMPGTDEND